MVLLLWVIGIYLLLGIIATIVSICKDPILLYAWILIPIMVLIWPYVLWVVVICPDNTGRWI